MFCFFVNTNILTLTDICKCVQQFFSISFNVNKIYLMQEQIKMICHMVKYVGNQLGCVIVMFFFSFHFQYLVSKKEKTCDPTYNISIKRS